MPECENKTLQSLLEKIHAMDDRDKETMLLLVAAYAAGKANAEMPAAS